MVSLTLYFGLKSGLMDISNTLYTTRERDPVYLQFMQILHIIMTASSAFLSYQIRDCQIIIENQSFYNLMNKGGNTQETKHQMPVMFWQPFCDDHSGKGNDIVTEPAGAKRCHECGADLGPVVDVVEDWFDGYKRPVAYFASVAGQHGELAGWLKGSNGFFLNDNDL